MDPRRLAVVCGTVVFAGWGAAGLLDFGWPRLETGASIEASQATSAAAGAEPIAAPQSATAEHDVAVTDAIASVAVPVREPESPSAPVAPATPEHDVAVADAASVGTDMPMARPMQETPSVPETPSVAVASADSERGVSITDGARVGTDVPAARPMQEPETPSAQVASADTEHAVSEAASAGADLPVAAPMPRSETPSAPVPPANTEHGVSVADAASVGADLPVDRPVREPATPSMQVASANPSDPMPGDTKDAVRSTDTPDECLVEETCIDRYLWSVYQRAPKVDTVRESERTSVTVKRKGKTRTVSRTITKLVDEDFTWKDPKAAEKAGMPMMDYVIGGIDRSFKLKLYRALRVLDDAGFAPGITSGFRDDYRQTLASGNKAATDRSYHGGSFRGGYGHGLAVDLVSVKGDTRAERLGSSQILWKWIDAHDKELGIGRPYLDRDPPHVGPIDGKEYADKRGLTKARLAESETKSETKGHHASAASDDHGKAKRRRTASLRGRST